MERNKIIIIGVASGLLVIGGVVAWAVIRNKKTDTNPTSDLGKDIKDQPTYTPTNQEMGSSDKLPSDKVIKIGSHGRKTARFQAMLNFVYGAGLSVDGSYGELTKAAVKKYLGYLCLFGDCQIEDKDWTNLAATAMQDNSKWVTYLASDKGYQGVLAKYNE